MKCLRSAGRMWAILLIVVPFVTCVWVWDLVTLATLLMYNKLYTFCFKRSTYLQERELLDHKDIPHSTLRDFIYYDN